MKILHINSHDNGGAAIAAIRLHKAMLKADIDSKILFRYKTNYNIPFSIQYTAPRKNIVERFRRRLGSKIPETRLDLKYKLNGHFSLLNRNDCRIDHLPVYKEADYIFFHSVSNFIDLESFFVYNKKPVIWTLHDMNPFTGGCHYSESCSRYETGCQKCPVLFNTPDSDSAAGEIRKKINLFRDSKLQMVSPSMWLKSCSEKSQVLGNLNHFYIPYSIDTDTFRRYNEICIKEIFNIPGAKKTLLFICDNLKDKRKGFDLLTEALKLINNRNVHLCIVGNNLEKELIPGEFSYFGRVSDEFRMALIYSASDCFILPSREDNLPNVMLESLCAGTPVIGFPVGGLTDIIRNDFNGIIAREISPVSLAESLTEFLDQSWKFDRLKISEHARSFFSQEKQVKAYLDLLK